ncbi:FAD-dependent monooxygenase [Streptomyces alanosinicus]|uniref:Oxygenase n=1 Tax=Streptomyces alanosinicus TaxID=68171 RepID=A0A918YVE5_9ACTN|nr:FAD-dependent monooxygenase [Streptomyces alanosinicus]GHE15232.1 oxygenase [Streptomyces alanosinicus]
MSRPGPHDVVVVGAGPIGLALTIALRLHGLYVMTVDKGPGPKREPRASVLWQRALEVLRDLGCMDAFAAHGLPLSTGEFHVAGHLAGVQQLHMGDTAFPGPLSIEQDSIERLLCDRVRQLGPDVDWSTEAVAVRVTPEHAEIDLANFGGRIRTVTARWVVGCEGAHSLVRKSLGIPFEGEQRHDLQCFQLNARPAWSHRHQPGTTRIFINRGVTLIAEPLPGGSTRLFAFLPDPEPRLNDPPTVNEMEAVVSAATAEAGVRLTPTTPRWANRARFHDRVATTLRHGPALLAGDSAHLWAPVGGRGLNTGLLGAHNLAWKLAAVHRGWGTEPLLDTYSDEQRRTALAVIRAMRRNVLELPPKALTLAAIRVLLPHALRRTHFQRQGALLLSDLGRNHRRSALSADRARPGAGGWLRAGDRLPDLSVTTDTGPARLHDLLSYRHWSLLLCNAHPDAGKCSALLETTHRYAMPVKVQTVQLAHTTRSGPVEGMLLLVRPDGYIGLRTRTTDRLGVTEYLDRWLVRRDG